MREMKLFAQKYDYHSYQPALAKAVIFPVMIYWWVSEINFSSGKCEQSRNRANIQIFSEISVEGNENPTKNELDQP